MNKEQAAEKADNTNALIDLLVSIRNAFLDAVEAINKFLEKNAPPPVKFEQLKESFPDGLRVLLSFSVQGDRAIIMPKGFLGSENFSKIADIVRRLNGCYVSAGKDSHFEVPLAP